MKRTVFPVGLALALCVLLAACDTGTGSPVANKEEIAKALQASGRQRLEDFRSKDPSKIAAHYAEDGVLAAANMPSMIGRDGIAKGLAALTSDPGFALDIANQKTEVSASGDLAYSRGTYNASYTNTSTKQPVTENGTYLTVHKRQSDGSWKIIEDVSTPSAPPTAGPVAAGQPIEG